MNPTFANLERIKMVGKAFLSGFNLGRPVGDWNRGAKNDFEDVINIQLLLEHVAKTSGQTELNPKGIDGKISRQSNRSSTVKAIRAFQKSFMNRPDGRVDPDGNTLKKLKKNAAGAQSVMKLPNPDDGKPSWLQGVLDNPNIGKIKSLLTGEPGWIDLAEAELGVSEIAGKAQNSRIAEYHDSVEGFEGKRTENNPWCASFINWVLEEAGYKGAESAWSHAWKSWGDGLSKPAVGSVAFIDWGKINSKKANKGHVGFVVGKTTEGKIVLLGGNQSDKVKYSAFPKKWIHAYRVPAGYVMDPDLYILPTLKVGKGGGYAETR